MNRSILWAVGAAFSIAVSAGAQEAPPKVDQGRIDAAINKGVAYLKAQAGNLRKFEHVNRPMQEDELVLWTLVHASVPENDPVFQKLLKEMLERKLEATYCVALQAMILEEIQRVKYQWRIKQCAQFLVDNQCKNGQWTYGEPTIYAEETPSEADREDVSTRVSREARRGGVVDFGGPGSRIKPEVKRRVRVEKKKDGPDSGDNSNTQYAALGMRACHDAGIIIPESVTARAIQWWRSSQKESSGPRVRFDVKDSLDAPVTGGASGIMEVVNAEPQGWCYKDHGDHKAYGSMTAGAVGSLAIWLYIKDDDGGKKKRSWKKDKDVHEGLAWLAANFSVTYNPGPYEHGDRAENSQHQFEYYLYALERAGMLYGTETMGTHWWYPEGAKVLLEKQAADGKWGGGVVDTCFAILFLKRATAPLVPTGEAGRR
ncbi:MAG: hypothetical protein ACK44W_13015 [Planctomycetota bacterium]